MDDAIRDQAARDAALDPAASFIVQAPAGSGKTGLLTQRFLRLLAEVEHPEEIVAITFTRKAAAEMRERILGVIEQAARGERADSPNGERTLQLARAVLVADAQHGWNLLQNPARLRVTTIDSFNASLTRQMPVGSGFGQQPAISEDANALCHAAVRRLLGALDRKSAPGPWLRVLLAHLDNRVDELAELLAGMLARRDLWSRHLEFHGLDRAALEAGLAREIETCLRVLAAEFPVHLHDAVPEIATRCAEYLDARGNGDDTTWLRELAGATGAPRPIAADLARWQQLSRLLLTGAGELRKARGLNATSGFPAASEKGIDAAEKHRRDVHKAAMSEILAALDTRPQAVSLLAKTTQLPPARYTDAQWQILDALNSLLPFAVLSLQEVFRERGEVDFAELAIRARDALGSGDDATDLAVKLDYQVRHLLVDEFQDTSHSQIDLLLRLTRNWEPGDGRSLFLVGDPMQSIYQFREAEVGHFLAVRESGLGPLSLDALQLSSNFRSQAGIVEWVNAAFSEIFPARDDISSGAIAFEPSQAVKPELNDAAVTVHAFEQYGHAAEAARVLELVRAAMRETDNAGTAILVRGRAHLAFILPLLRDSNIAFRAVDLESLEQVPVVRDLLALTRSLVNPADTTALLACLRAPWCGLDLHALAALVDDAQPLFLRLQDEAARAALDTDARQRLERTLDVLQQAEAQRGRIGLAARVEAAWLALGGPATLREAEELDDAALFFGLLEQEQSGGDLDDVNAFDERLRQLFAAPDPDAGDALQIMTLHKAKGLQFDTVIIPALDQVTGRRDRLLFQWIERARAHAPDQVLLGPLKSRGDEEGGAIYRFIERLKEEKESLERARLLYVGITRAKRRVHLLGKAAFSYRNGTTALASPRKGSLLELLWTLPAVRTAFEGLPLPGEKPQRPNLAPAAAPLRRLAQAWRAPDLDDPAGLQMPKRATASESEQVLYEWAGDRARHVGTLVHRVLEHIARDGMQAWTAERLARLPLSRQLAGLGVPETECEAAAGEVRAILERVRGSEHAAWIFDSAHQDARNEWALGGLDRGELVSVSMDRSFVADGTRWIIDYKTSRHEGGNLEGFLAQQRERYRGQLERYARLVRALDPRPVKLALYFPLQDALSTWTPELD